MAEQSRGERWARYTDTPLLVLAVGFLVAYAIPILFPLAPRWLTRGCVYYEWLVWAVFAVDYAVRFTLAEHRRQFFRSHIVDLLAVILPMFRAMRLLRLLSIVTLLARRGGGRKIQQATTYVIGFAVLLIVVSSLAVLDAERFAEGSKIQDFGDSVWWSLVTMTTVGYGDLTPVTPTGRIVGILVMLTGIAVLGVVTANISSWFVAAVQEPDDKDARIAELEATIARLRGKPEPTRPPQPQPVDRD